MQVHCAHDEIQPLEKLIPHPRNPNTHTDEQIDLLARIMDAQGVRNPIKVSTLSGFITAGHGRLLAAKKNGWKDFPVDLQDYESEAMEYADLVADNAIAELSKQDLSKINIDIQDLGPDLDVELLGIPDFTVEPLDRLEPQCDEDETPEAPKEARTKPGDIYELGNHRLMCGDSADIQNCCDELLQNNKAEMLFTDPPYGVSYEGGHHLLTGQAKREQIKNDNIDIYSDVIPLAAELVDGPCYIWFAGSKALPVYQAVNEVGQIHALIIWHKINATYAAMSAQYKPRHEPCLYWKPKGSNLRWDGPTTEATIWEMKRDPKNDLHPTQKPVALAERAISNHKVETVLDLFGGSGTTLIACEKTNRKCFMMEIDPIYCDVIVSRYVKYTGNDRIKLNGEEITWSS